MSENKKAKKSSESDFKWGDESLNNAVRLKRLLMLVTIFKVYLRKNGVDVDSITKGQIHNNINKENADFE